jgi:hypothetical protein
MPDATKTPGLSVVLQTDRFETIAPVVDRLKAQSVSARIELILVTDAPREVEEAVADLDGFASIRVIEAGPGGPLSCARALGVHAARAPVVFLGETHSFVGAEWARRLLEAHRDWDVVVPCFGNANPDTALSWAAFIQDYGDCGEGKPAGEPSEWPGYNVTYRRAFLQAFGDELDVALHRGDELGQELRRRGGRVYFAPDIRVDHLNVDRPRSWLHERFLRGRLIAAHRREPWPQSKRIAYALAAPLVALVLMRRNWPALVRSFRGHRLPAGTAPAWVLGFLVRAAGEALGYAWGARASDSSAMEEYETHKFSYTRSRT